MLNISAFIFISILQIYFILAENGKPFELNFFKNIDYIRIPLTKILTVQSDEEYLQNVSNFNFSIFQEELPLMNSKNDEMKVQICLGTPPQCFNVLVDSGSFYLWVTDKYSFQTLDSEKKFDYKHSTSFVNLNIPYKMVYGTGSAEGFISSETATIGNTKLPDLKFILVNKEENHVGLDGILGLGYYYEDFDKGAIQFSLIDQLYEKKLINKRIFTQKYTENKQGKMYVGDFPKEITDDMENYGNCDAIKYTNRGLKNPRWQCNLKTIFFGNENNVANSEILDEPALFDTGTNIILSSLTFLQTLQTTYFKDLIDYGYCQLVVEQQKFYSFKCMRNADVLNLPPINFVFGEWILIMNPIELFHLYPDNSIRFIISSSNDLNQWIIGEPLLKKFHIVFDKDSDKIGFYGKDGKYKSSLPFPSDTSPFIIFLIVLACALAVGLIILLVITLIRKRRSKQTYYTPDMYYRQQL